MRRLYGLTIAVICLMVCGSVVSQQCCEDYCYDTDTEKPQSAHFGTKTAYQIIKGSDSQRQYVVPNCNPVKIWILSRHGTRLPSVKDIKELKELSNLRDEVVKNYEERRTKPDEGALCDEDLELIKNWNWNPNISGDYENFLTVQGWNDLKYLAINYQRIFPNLLENIYAPEKFLFRHTKRQRTEASYKAFVEGLFGDKAYDHIQVPQMPDQDMFLRPYDMCQAWKENSKIDKSSPDSEQSKFEESQQFHKMIGDVSQRLGFKFALKTKQIKNMWDMCRYDQSWTLDRPSAWCAAFTQSQINVLEYNQDIKYYYESGYGHDLNAKIACATVADMMKHMESTNLPKVVASFGHTATVQLLLSALGAAKDYDALRADNYQQMMRRKWKSSELTPFGANLAVIKYDCPSDSERNKIMFFMNQKPLDFPWCNVGLCNWSQVKQMYAGFETGSCSSSFCTGRSGAMATVGMVSTTLLLVGTMVAGVLKMVM